MSLGAAGEVVARHLAGGRAGIERLAVVDSSAAMLQRCRDAAAGAADAVQDGNNSAQVWPQVWCMV